MIEMPEPLNFLYDEMTACGLTINHLSSGGHDTSNNTLATLIRAAHGKLPGSDELTALKTALTSDQWAAYINTRKRPIHEARLERLLRKGKLIVKMIELMAEANPVETPAGSGKVVLRIDQAAWAAWRAAVAQIKTDLPYEVE